MVAVSAGSFVYFIVIFLGVWQHRRIAHSTDSYPPLPWLLDSFSSGTTSSQAPAPCFISRCLCSHPSLPHLESACSHRLWLHFYYSGRPSSVLCAITCLTSTEEFSLTSACVYRMPRRQNWASGDKQAARVRANGVREAAAMAPAAHVCGASICWWCTFNMWGALRAARLVEATPATVEMAVAANWLMSELVPALAVSLALFLQVRRELRRHGAESEHYDVYNQDSELGALRYPVAPRSSI
jgi:hypothetical protein